MWAVLKIINYVLYSNLLLSNALSFKFTVCIYKLSNTSSCAHCSIDRKGLSETVCPHLTGLSRRLAEISLNKTNYYNKLKPANDIFTITDQSVNDVN